MKYKNLNENKNNRLQLIKEIEKQRDSKIIVYITSTRPNLDTQMGLDVIRYIYDHLEKIKNNSEKPEKLKIDLFIHSNGGDGTVPWRLVTLIREYTNDFGVIVPHRAFSAATLTALGATEIIMHPMGMLGPTDPSVSNHFNPIDPKTGQYLPISVEDVTAYIQLIKEDAGIQHEDELVHAIKILAEKVHPLALGNVKRSISQSRMMASKLLNLHMQKSQEHKIQEIADNLTSKLFYHGHPINRKEARELGLETVKDNIPKSLEQAIWNLYLEYEKNLELLNPFDPATEFMSQFSEMKDTQDRITELKNAKLVYIESTYDCDILSMNYRLLGTKKQPGGTTIIPIIESKQWTKENNSVILNKEPVEVD